MNKLNISLNLFEYHSINEMNEEEKQLIEEAKKATESSYAPYSKFHVGASVLLENGEIISGSNQENAAYPSGICAERVALFYANSKFPQIKIKAIAVAAKSNGIFSNAPISPCGSCRQVLLEAENRFKYPIKIILFGEDRILLIENASTLLPIGFGEEFLKK